MNLNENKQDLKNVNNESIELAFWLNILGFESRTALSEFLSSPLIKEKSMERQLLRSWAGRKLLDEVSDLVRLDQDTSGLEVLLLVSSR